MKYFMSVLSLCSLCAALSAQSEPLQSDKMPVVADLGAGVLQADGSIMTVYPATITLEGQWCDVALWKGPFSVTEYPSYRVKLQRGFEDAYVQLFARNAWSASNFGGPYMPFEANQVLLEGEFSEDDTDGNFEDDPVCTWFALQKTNIGPESLTVTVLEAVLIDEDGNEIVSHNVRNGSWKPSPDWVEPDPLYEADVKFTSKGIVGLYDATVDPGNVHRFTFKTSTPMPAGFTFYYVLDDGDDTTYSDDVPAGTTSYVSPLIDDSYIRAYLEFEGDYPTTLHFSSITREVFEQTGISDVKTDLSGTPAYYNLSGQQLQSPAKGLNIVSQQQKDGSTRVQYITK